MANLAAKLPDSIKGITLLTACGGPQGVTPSCWSTIGWVALNRTPLLPQVAHFLNKTLSQQLRSFGATPQDAQTLSPFLTQMALAKGAAKVKPLTLRPAIKALEYHRTQKGVTLTLTLPKGGNPQAFDRKIKALQDLAERGKLRKSDTVRDRQITRQYQESLQKSEEHQWGNQDPQRMQRINRLLKAKDADHAHELQLGGHDHQSNLQLLNRP